MELRLSDPNSFDFEIGYLVKSPCKDCNNRKDLPECIEDCELLYQIQMILAYSIPSEKSISALEAYDVPNTVIEHISHSENHNSRGWSSLEPALY